MKATSGLGGGPSARESRLGRLVGNVLDYSRLEKQHPRLNRSRVSAKDLLAQVGAVWQGRCGDADKELMVEISSLVPQSEKIDKLVLERQP